MKSLLRFLRAPLDPIRKYQRLRSDTRTRIRRIETMVEQMSVQLQETNVVLRDLAVPRDELWRGKPDMVDGSPASRVFDRSAVCRQNDFDQPYFAYWTRRLAEPLRYHRKVWEFVFIVQSLWERGAIRPGARGLGFGVGQEPLSALFASEGCLIVATDMTRQQAIESGWAATNQHADDLAALRRPFCADDVFDANVSFEHCDMNAVSDHLVDFDFCWSACALEHLGSIADGLSFVERSLDCVKPGGLVVHTTEYNFSSNDRTVDHADTVLFRERDLRALAARLEAQGHWVAPLDLDPGDRPVDRYVDMAPYRDQPHLKVALRGFGATSVGLIIRRSDVSCRPIHETELA